MRAMLHVTLAIVIVGLAAAFPISGLGQGRRADVIGGPLTGPPVVGAPFSAEATTIFNGMRADGTRFQRSMPAVYYRDAAGRVRVELTIDGGQAPRISVQPEPGQSMYWLDASKRSARVMIFEEWIVGGGKQFSVAVAVNKFLHVFRFLGVENLLEDTVEESLGRRRIAGVETSGRRITITVPVGYLGNDRPLEIVDERWESPELHLLIESSYSDPRFGRVEYSVTNIRQSEPPPNLFAVPDDYNNNAPPDEPWLSFIPFTAFLAGKHPAYREAKTGVAPPVRRP